MTATGLTELETKAIDALVDAWNAFMELPVIHGDDVDEFRHGIHALQQKIMSRPVRTVYAPPTLVEKGLN